jgi:hypothetical protein
MSNNAFARPCGALGTERSAANDGCCAARTSARLGFVVSLASHLAPARDTSTGTANASVSAGQKRLMLQCPTFPGQVFRASGPKLRMACDGIRRFSIRCFRSTVQEAVYSVISRTTRQWLPAANTPSGTSRVTMLPVPLAERERIRMLQTGGGSANCGNCRNSRPDTKTPGRRA